MSCRLERNSAFGELVRCYADHHHLPQKALAADLGIKERQFRRYKNGLVPAATAMLDRLKSVLGIPSEEMNNVLKAPADNSAHAIRKLPRVPKFNLEKVKSEFQNAELMRSSPVLYEFFKQEVEENHKLFKGAKLSALGIKRVNISMPAAIIARARNKQFKIELQKLTNTTVNRLHDVEQNGYVQKRNLVAKNLISNPDNVTFALRELSIDGDTCKVFGSCTTYLSTLATHDELEHELLSAAYVLNTKQQLTVKELQLPSRLPKRDAFFQRSAIEQSKYRGIAIATLVVYNTPKEGYKVMFRKRSEHVAAHPGLFHVIPACMFQAEFDKKKEWNIEYCVVKEWCEELFREEVDYSYDDPYYIFDRWPSAADMRKALHARQCELIHSGIVLNLTNLRPELCCVLLIHDCEWFKSQKFKPNWEYVSRNEMVRSANTTVSEYDLANIEDEFAKGLAKGDETAEAKLVGKWLPTGLAALWLGVDAARMRVG